MIKPLRGKKQTYEGEWGPEWDYFNPEDIKSATYYLENTSLKMICNFTNSGILNINREE